ncbi:MAG: AAA family ATPase [Gemmatimonadales bacterium]|nr:AAA family ATPase [Gemmatimonadales bacterium]
MLVLHTLGELRLGGGWTAKLSSPRIALTLLAYLARRSPRPVSRGELADLFWRERDAARARQSLRQVLLELKRIIGDGLVADTDRVFLTPGALALDVVRFEDDVAAGRWQEAVEGWRGEFLASADNVGGEDFRLWLEAEREGQHRSLRVSFRGLIERARANGNWREGLALAQRWVEQLPLEEEGHRHLIHLTHLDGHTVEALTLYAAFHARLRAADSEPTPAFLQLGTALERDAVGASGRRTPSSAALFTPDLTGRGHALAELEAVWRSVRAGTPATVLVEGEAGIGKSRFCGEFLRRLASETHGATILRVRGYEAAPHGALAAIAELVNTLVAAPGASGASPAALGEIARLALAIRERFPSLPQPTGQGHGLEDALVELLGAVSAERPVVLYFDDLPSADSATQQLLMSVSDRISTAVLFLVTALTGEDRTSAYVELATRAGVRRLKLQPLALGDIEVLLGSMLELAPSARNHLAQRLHAETGGNPFYIIELTAALVDDGLLLPTDAGAWRLEPSETGRPIPLPATIREVVGRRLDRLSLDSRTAVEAAAVLGRAFDPALVPLVVGVAPATLTGALEELIARRIVRECTGSPGGYEFTHEIMHRVAYDLLPAPRREALHRAAALAYHPDAGLDPGAERAFSYHQAQAGLSSRPGWHRSSRRRILLAALTSVVVVAGVGAGLLRKQQLPWDLQRVEVAPFENQTGDSSLDAVGRMAADWINRGWRRRGWWPPQPVGRGTRPGRRRWYGAGSTPMVTASGSGRRPLMRARARYCSSSIRSRALARNPWMRSSASGSGSPRRWPPTSTRGSAIGPAPPASPPHSRHTRNTPWASSSFSSSTTGPPSRITPGRRGSTPISVWRSWTPRWRT